MEAVWAGRVALRLRAAGSRATCATRAGTVLYALAGFWPAIFEAAPRAAPAPDPPEARRVRRGARAQGPRPSSARGPGPRRRRGTQSPGLALTMNDAAAGNTVATARVRPALSRRPLCLWLGHINCLYAPASGRGRVSWSAGPLTLRNPKPNVGFGVGLGVGTDPPQAASPPAGTAASTPRTCR